jgi:hypothetical protein
MILIGLIIDGLECSLDGVFCEFMRHYDSDGFLAETPRG